MFTYNEVSEILSNHYTPEELVDILEVDSDTLVKNARDTIEDRLEELSEMIAEDLGYYYAPDES